MKTAGKLFIVLLFTSAFHTSPLLFMGLTLWLSQRSLSRLELDKGIHDIQFYLTRPLSQRFQRLFHWYCKFETFFRSIALSCLALFLFGGTSLDRITGLSFWFTICVGIAMIILKWVRNHTSIRALRWGYTRMSIALGILYSLFASLVQGISLSDIAYRTAVKEWWETLTVADVLEVAYGSMYHLNQFIQSSLNALLGNFAGGFLGIFVSVNIIYGFLIFVTAAFLIEEQDAETVPHLDK